LKCRLQPEHRQRTPCSIIIFGASRDLTYRKLIPALYHLFRDGVLPINASEIRIEFQRTPHVLFAAQCGNRLGPNSLILQLQPDEGISLRFNRKVPGPSLVVRPVRMHFSYHTAFGAYTREAYERLLLDAIEGDSTLFLRRDEVEAAWEIVDPIRIGWGDRPLTNREFYAAGTWGPAAAEDFIAQTGHQWHTPEVGRKG